MQGKKRLQESKLALSLMELGIGAMFLFLFRVTIKLFFHFMPNLFSKETSFRMQMYSAICLKRAIV